MLSDSALLGFRDKNNPNRYEPLKKLLYYEQPTSRYPATQHLAIVTAINAFHEQLSQERQRISSPVANSLQCKQNSSSCGR
jgi:hypothetical protein